MCLEWFNEELFQMVESNCSLYIVFEWVVMETEQREEFGFDRDFFPLNFCLLEIFLK